MRKEEECLAAFSPKRLRSEECVEMGAKGWERERVTITIICEMETDISYKERTAKKSAIH